MPVYLTNLSDATFRDLQQPSTLSIPSIAYWYRAHIGDLNNLLGLDFSIDSSTSEPLSASGTEFGNNEASIFETLYLIHYYDILYRGSLGASSYSSNVLEVSSNGATVRMLSRVNIAASYLQAKKIEIENLNKMITAYKGNSALPLQVAGDDSIPGGIFRSYDSSRSRWPFSNNY